MIFVCISRNVVGCLALNIQQPSAVFALKETLRACGLAVQSMRNLLMTTLANPIHQGSKRVGILARKFVVERKDFARHLTPQFLDLFAQPFQAHHLNSRPSQVEAFLQEHQAFELKKQFQSLVHGQPMIGSHESVLGRGFADETP